MNKDTISLLVYLDNRYVFSDGLIDEEKLSAADMKTIEYWQHEGQLHIEKLPLPDGTEKTEHTHKIRMSKQLFEVAHTARRKYAERHKPMKNGQLNSPPLKGVQGDDLSKSQKNKTIDFDHYLEWMQQKEAALTPPQHMAARLIFAVLDDPALRLFVNQKGAGQSWLFKSIDQYLTLIKNNTFKSPPSKGA